MRADLSTVRARARPLPLALLLLVIAVAAVTSVGALLMLSPALALLLLLLSGRAPEELILRWQRRVPPPRRRPARFVARGRLPLPLRRSERMSASALAMRPPPARAAITSV